MLIHETTKRYPTLLPYEVSLQNEFIILIH